MSDTQKKESIFKRKPWIGSVLIAVLIFGLLAAFLVWQSSAGTVLIENSTLEAPVVNLAPSAPGTLNGLYVKEGDTVAAGTEVAEIGTAIITAKEAGVVASAPNALGGYYNPGQTVVSVIKTSAMEAVGQIEENKGLKDIAVGQRATFTVDAFPGTTCEGIVDEVSPTSVETGIAFSISDKRPVNKFEVKVRFDTSRYPELKNGMSAKITVHTKR